MILPILGFSQIDSVKVKEVISQNGDTLVIMAKSHAKELAKERVRFKYLQNIVFLKDTLISEQERAIQDYRSAISNLKGANLVSDGIISNQNILINSYKQESEKLTKQLRRSKNRGPLWFLGGAISVGGIIAILK